MQSPVPKRIDNRIIIHFDYDCFYAAVFERADPRLKSLPFAVQQKQIIVTCNYEARRKGLYKLQLVRDARKVCPDVIIALGEDLTRFRNASKDNFDFLRKYAWSDQVERLGFDEVFMDVTDLIDYNMELLNRQNPSHCFFHLDPKDPTVGFSYDSTTVSGHIYPPIDVQSPASLAPAPDDAEDLILRLQLGSQFAGYLRRELEDQKGFTSTVGISTNKLLSKLVGNVNKPKGQTTLITPYNPNLDGVSTVNQFIDDHDIGKIPGIGFKIAQKIRAHILGRPATFDAGLVYGGTRETVAVKDVRTFDKMGPKLLQSILGGPGVPKDLPEKVWGLINGVDDAGVTKAREVPQQISLEDSYIRLDQIDEVAKELKLLSINLINRMRIDLTKFAESNKEADVTMDLIDTDANHSNKAASRRWIAHPKSIRLSTRPRPTLGPDGTRSRTFARISKSASMPSFVFSLSNDAGGLAARLVEEILLPLFRKLHPEKSGWNLSLVNLCVTDMVMSANERNAGSSRDISEMFRRQDDTFKLWKKEERDNLPDDEHSKGIFTHETDKQKLYTSNDFVPSQTNGSGSEDMLPQTQSSINGEDDWDSEEDGQNPGDACRFCGAIMPAFAMVAHERFHDFP